MRHDFVVIALFRFDLPVPVLPDATTFYCATQAEAIAVYKALSQRTDIVSLQVQEIQTMPKEWLEEKE